MGVEEGPEAGPERAGQEKMSKMDPIKAYVEFTRCFGYVYTYDEFVTMLEATKQSLKRHMKESKQNEQRAAGHRGSDESV